MATEEKNNQKEETISNWFKIDGEDKSEEEYCAWVNKQATEHPVVAIFHGKWKELISWEEGNQFALWSKKDNKVIPININRETKVVINLMKPLNEAIEGKINIQHSVIGTPNSGEAKDIYGAQVATRLINYNDYVNEIDVVFENLKYDLLRPGEACIKWIWDKNYYGMVAPKKDGKVDKKEEVREPGEVMVQNVPIFNIRPDPTAKTQAQLRWVIELMEVTKQELLEKYPKAKDIIEGLNPSDKTKYEGMNEPLDEKDDKEKTLVIKEHWEKANSDYPKGRYIVSCQNRVIHKGRNISPKAWLPFFFFYYKKSPYSFWCHGPLYYVQGLQRLINRLVSMEIEHIEAWKPKMAVGKGALKVASAMTVDPFELVEIDFSRGEPKPIQMPELSPQVGAMRDFLIGAVDRVSNVHEVSYARLPQYASRAPSSLYTQMLEQESTKLDPMIKQMNAVFLKMDQFRLMLMDQHYKMPRMVKIMGKNKSATIEYFEAADLNQNFDVRLETGVSLNQSPSIQTRMILELYTNGILGEKDKPKILRMLNLGTGENEFQEDLADSERAMRENQAFIEGTDEKPETEGGVKIYIHDDHELHIESHTNLRKSDEAAKWDDARKGRCDNHINDHFMILAYLKQGMAPGQIQTGAVGGQPGAGTIAGGPAEGVPGQGAGRPTETVPGQGQIPAPGGGMQQPTMP